MDRRSVVLLSVCVFAFFLCEYTYLPFEGDETQIKIILKDFSIRRDSYVYSFFIKIEQLIFVLVIQLLFPIREYTKWMVYAFALAIVEYPLTYNEPLFKILLPELNGFHPYIPVSTAMLKLISVAYFMYGCIKKVMG